MPNMILPAASPDALAASIRQARLRGLMHRALLSNASDAAAMAAPPTITVNGDTVTTGLSQAFGTPPTSAQFTVYGGAALPVGGNAYWRVPTTTVGSGGNSSATRQSVGSRIAFRTDAPSFDIAVMAVQASARYRILIDGHYVDKVGYAAAGNAGSYGTFRINVAFAGGTARRLRRIDVEMENDMAFRGVHVAPGDTVQPVATADRYRIAVVGDSISAATGATRANDGWCYHAGRRIGNMDVDMVSISLGGTGYTTASATPGFTSFGARLDDLLAFGAGGIDEVWFAGGANDQSASAATVTAAALATFQGARARLPMAPVIVLGGFVGGGTAAGASAAVATETAVKAAFDAWADPNSAFVPFNLAAPKLQTGTSASPTSGNYQSYMTGGDGTHPTDAGHDYIGLYVAEARRAIRL